MEDTTNTSKTRHVPRRSGVGMRFPIVGSNARKWRTGGGRFRPTPVAPEVCGAPHPDRGYDVTDDQGVLNAITCTGKVDYVEEEGRFGRTKTKRVPHRGPHRARVGGALIRWAD